MTPEAGAPSLPDLFAHAVELDDGARRAFVAELAAREPAVARELEQLLAGAGAAVSPLDRSPWRGLEATPESDTPPLPEKIANFRVLRELGRGGMGRVYLAEEATEDFRRTVALKVIDRPAFDADAVRRFREEVRILSSLEHPGIARFLDGGRAGDGTFYLALEYVEGEDLLTYATRHELPIRKRLELFLGALDAVRHAHERGVVHRDLKPSHLLVGTDGRPRLLDFGISKLVDRDATAPITVTRTESRALTPAYASPEQFRGEPVSPASDVYALGGVLYELLAGRRPFAEATGGSLERAVLDFDPEPPSVAARRLATARSSTSTRSTRSTRVGTLGRDLDAICLKALRKNAAERYADAGELADDVERYLAGLPVEARRGGRRYRMARFLHRHRGTLVTAAAIALAGVAAFVAWRAQREVAGLRPAVVTPTPFPFSNVEELRIEEIERRFTADPANVDAGATLVLGLLQARRLDEAKLIVARLRQIPDEGENPLIDYVEAMLAVEGEEPQRGLVLYTRSRDRALAQGRGDLVAQVRASRGRLLATLGQREEGARDMELARADFERAGDHASLSRVLNDLAIEELQQGRFDRGEELLKLAVEEGRRAGTTIHWMLRNLAELDSFRGRPDRAEGYLRELDTIHRGSGNRRFLGDTLGLLGSTLYALGRAGEWEAPLDEAIADLRATGEAAILRNHLAVRQLIDLERGRSDRFAATVAEIESRASGGGDYYGTAMVAALRAHEASSRGDLATMRKQYGLARALLLEGGDTDQAAVIDAAETVAEWRAGNADSAARLAAQTIARLPPGAAESEPSFLARAILVRIDAAAGRLDDARRRFATLGDGAASPAVVRRLAWLAARAAIAAGERRVDDARRDLEAAIDLASRSERRLDEAALRRDLASLPVATGTGG